MSVGPNDPGHPPRDSQGQLPPAPLPGPPLPASPQVSDLETMRRERPGWLTGAAVVGFVAAGVEILGGLLWILGGSMINELENAAESDAGPVIMVLGLVFVITGGGYLWGGVMALKSKTFVLYAAAGIGVVSNIVVLVLFQGGLFGLVLGVVVLLLLAVGQRQLRRSY